MPDHIDEAKKKKSGDMPMDKKDMKPGKMKGMPMTPSAMKKMMGGGKKK